MSVFRLRGADNPRFRGKGWYDSFTYPQTGFSLEPGKLSLSKIGDVKIKLHRQIEGRIKRLTVRRAATGKSFACFSVEVEEVLPPWKDETPVGVDVGLESFVTLSNGDKIDNPRFFRSAENALAKAQRRLSKTHKGTSERNKALKVLERVHERIANKRYDFVQQLSHDLVDKFGTICFESQITLQYGLYRLGPPDSDKCRVAPSPCHVPHGLRPWDASGIHGYAHR